LYVDSNFPGHLVIDCVPGSIDTHILLSITDLKVDLKCHQICISFNTVLINDNPRQQEV